MKWNIIEGGYEHFWLGQLCFWISAHYVELWKYLIESIGRRVEIFKRQIYFFVKIGMRGCNKKKVPKKFLNPSLYFAVVSFLEPRKLSVCESVKQIFPLIFIVDETGF